jgi:hypothetical protein
MLNGLLEAPSLSVTQQGLQVTGAPVFRAMVIDLLKEILHKSGYRHAVAKRHPVNNVPPSYLPPERGKGIPAFAGMTTVI